MRVIVTGSSGFVASGLITQLVATGLHDVVAFSRSCNPQLQSRVRWVATDNFRNDVDWKAAISGVEAVIHTAGRAHITSDVSDDPLREYRRINVTETLKLAQLAAAAEVRRFVFLSSVKVLGEWTDPGEAFSAGDIPAPRDAYGLSKWEAEQGLAEIARQTGMEVAIVRPPLVYGPGVKANFLAMMRALYRGIPLPLGAIHNRRSLVALDNLVDLLVRCLENPEAANRTFLVCDGEDISTTELLRRMGRALGRPARLLRVPEHMLRLGAKVLGKSEVAHRLCGSLQVDIKKTRRLLGWSPPITVDEGLHRAAEGFLREAGGQSVD